MSKQLYGKMKNQLTSNFLGSHLMIYTYVLKHQSLVYAVAWVFFFLLFIHRKRNRGEKGIESMTSLHSWMISLPIDFGTFISRKLSLLPKTSRKALIYMSHTMASFLIFCPFFFQQPIEEQRK